MALGGTWANLRMLSSKPAGSSIDVNEEQSRKAPSPRLVRLAGSSIDVIEEQPSSAIDVIEEQPSKAHFCDFRFSTEMLLELACSDVDRAARRPHKPR